MKASLILSFLALQVTNVLSTAVEECGALGVMEIPEGADSSSYRKCLEHPTALNATLESGEHLLTKRECWSGTRVGCSKEGYCYKNCQRPGSGNWCWLAWGGGHGDWTKCGSDSDCQNVIGQIQCGRGGASCNTCGCSC